MNLDLDTPSGPLPDGVYINLPFDRYCRQPAVNQSLLKVCGEVSPKHAVALMRGEMQRDTNTLKMGRAEHAYIIEGEEEFRKRHPVAGRCCGVLKTGDRAGQTCGKSATHRVLDLWYCKTHANEFAIECHEAISEFDFRRIQRMGEAVRRHEINVHLARKGWSECTILYTLEVEFSIHTCPACNGIDYPHEFERLSELNRKCCHCREVFTVTAPQVITVPHQHKIRIDRLGRPNDKFPRYVACDLKRMQTMQGDRKSRERCISNYSWDVQAAMYVEGVRVAMERGLPVFNERGYEVDTFAQALDDFVPFLWIFVEENPPHDVTWFPADEQTLSIGADKLKRYRKAWAKVMWWASDDPQRPTDDFPGRCVGVQSAGGLPEWEKRQYERDYADDNGVYA